MSRGSVDRRGPAPATAKVEELAKEVQDATPQDAMKAKAKGSPDLQEALGQQVQGATARVNPPAVAGAAQDAPSKEVDGCWGRFC